MHINDLLYLRGIFVYTIVSFTPLDHTLGCSVGIEMFQVDATSNMNPSKLLQGAMESGNVFNLQDFEQNEIQFKQRSFQDSIGTFFNLFDTDLLLIWMNTFQHGFHFHCARCLLC